MRLEAEKLLFTIYAEINSISPVMEGITADRLGFDRETFNRALNILYTGGYISGVEIKFGDEETQDAAVSYSNALLTRKGAEYVEGLTGLDADMSKLDKLKLLHRKALEWGWQEVAALAEQAIKED
mgnify:CR=1 FL=1